MFKKEDVKIVSKEKEFWMVRKEAAERVLADMKRDIESLPHIIEMQEGIIKLCEQKVKATK